MSDYNPFFRTVQGHHSVYAANAVIPSPLRKGASHSYEQRLDGQLQRPQPYFLKPTEAGLLI